MTAVSLPTNVIGSNTRMRVAMRYGSFPVLCSNPAYGEVEDYTLLWDVGSNLVSGSKLGEIAVLSGVAKTSASTLQLFPNPVAEVATITGTAKWMKPFGCELWMRKGGWYTA
ncbi:MAG: GEVED domain-containing protein [Saprospiraceae bacterium]